MMSAYTEQAEAWATKYGVTMTATFTGHRKYFADDTDTRDTYRIELRRGERSMQFDYGASLNDSMLRDESSGPYWKGVRNPKVHADNAGASRGRQVRRAVPPTMYGVVTCLEKWPASDTFAGWCSDLGYSTDSRKALETYLAVQVQTADFLRLCNGDAAMLADAQEIS